MHELDAADHAVLPADCPRCGQALAPGSGLGGAAARRAEECPACGVVIAKALVAAPARRARRRTAPLRGETTAGNGSAERRALAFGVGLGLLVFVLPPTRYALSYGVTVFHELGHTAMAWAFGYPTVPSFDFAYGGGISIHFGRSTPLAVLAGCGVAWQAWRLRGTGAFWPAVTIAAAYALAALTSLHELLVLAAGHGAELLVGGICLYRALAPLRWPPAERAAYAGCAAFLLASDARFGWQLLASAAFRRDYEQAKGGGHWMDLSRIAEGLAGIDLALVAVAFCLAVLVTPLLAHLVAINHGRLRAALEFERRA